MYVKAKKILSSELMYAKNLSEDDAFARLRKASQVSGRPLKVIAEAVIDTLDPS